MPSMISMRIMVAGLIACSHAAEFLQAKPFVDESVSKEDLEKTLSEEIQNSLGAGAASRRNLLEAILLPLYNALPKNENGKLGHSTVRYALHRLFVLRHGWNIRGLHARNSSSPIAVLKGQAPDYIQDLFERRLGGKGLGLRELAVLAATVEHLVHNEIVGMLEGVFEVFDLSTASILDDDEVDLVLDTYLMGFVLGRDVSAMETEKVHMFRMHMPEIFTGWRESQKFLRRIHNNVTGNPSATQRRQDFASLAKVVEIFGEEYGSFQNIECQELKRTLMEKEYRGTGRVKLADFYKPALQGAWQFQESLGYLRQLGAVDETDPSSPSVIIPNYLHSQTNCLAASGFYSVCCKDECEGLMGHLEEKLVAPEAQPGAIVELITHVPSVTTVAPRKLPATLLRRLDDISTHHDGMVPLHGRLFAQWMHHAFPRECPYPHLSGTTNQQTAIDWSAEAGRGADATQEEMMSFVEVGNDTASVLGQDAKNAENEELLHWSTEEELLVMRQPSQVMQASRYTAVRNVVLLMAVGSFAVSIVKSFKSIAAGSLDIDNAKFLV